MSQREGRISWRLSRSHLVCHVTFGWFLPSGAGRGRGKAAAPGGNWQGRHFRGQNSEFWRLHCNMLAQFYICF